MVRRSPSTPVSSATTTAERASLVTEILEESEPEGTEALAERLLPLVYDELRNIARSQRRRRAAGTLQTTALVHEAYLRLVGRRMVPNRRYFFSAAAQAMRNVLVDHARRRSVRERADLSAPDPETIGSRAARVLDVHEALDRLAAFDERAARVVECRYFGGLTVEETAEAVGVGTATVKRDWRQARAWLQLQLGEETLDDAAV